MSSYLSAILATDIVTGVLVPIVTVSREQIERRAGDSTPGPSGVPQLGLCMNFPALEVELTSSGRASETCPPRTGTYIVKIPWCRALLGEVGTRITIQTL